MRDSGIELIGEIPAHWKILQVRRSLKKLEQGNSPAVLNRDEEEMDNFYVLKISHLCKRSKTPRTPTINPRGRNLKPSPTIRTLRQQPQLMLVTSIRLLKLPLHAMTGIFPVTSTTQTNRA